MMNKLVKNKRGSSLFVMLMYGIIFFILGLALAHPLSQTVDESMSTPELNCSATDITNQDKAVCTSIDTQRFLFIGIIFGMAGIFIGAMR